MKKFSKRIYLSPPNLNGSEIKHVRQAFESNWIAPIGPNIKKFEDKISNYVGVKYAAALSSGTAALHLALKVLGVEKGDKVFCSDLTFVASANAIRYVGADPVFIDSNIKSWNMCHLSLKDAFELYNPKAVIITDIYGQSAEFDILSEICKKNNTPIIEDAAESLGASLNSSKCGSFGDISILSFNGNKIITTSGGGMLLSDKKAFIEKAIKLATQARENKIHYEHKEIGYNYRMSNILASIGLGQLNTLNKVIIKKRQIFNNYKEGFKDNKNIQFMPSFAGSKPTKWLTVMLIKNKPYKGIKEIIEKLEGINVESRPLWKPMHLQPLFKGCDFISNNRKNFTKTLFNHGLCLPSGSDLRINDQKKIINFIKKNIRN